MEFLKRLWSDEEGQGLVEYGLILALVSLVAIVGLGLLGVEIDTLFDTVITKFP